MTQGTGSPAFRYYAFISYSHQDKAWADWLHKALETYRVPKRLVGQATTAGTIPARLTPIFRDRDELASSHNLGDKVNEALAQSTSLIVICSPRSARSRWVQEEVLAFRRLGRAARTFCLIVEGEPNASDLPGREAEECFAPALRFQLDAAGRSTTQHAEPIAADARLGKDGKPNAKLKLIAGMLEVGFDALKQRELRRRARRMTTVATLALVVMAGTAVLAVAALISRHNAVLAQQKALVARQAAVVAQAAAERRQKQAEGLVGFMLGDLNDKLTQVGRLDIMQAVDDKAMAYFAALPAADATDSALALRVTALEKIGSVRMDQGRIPPALKAYLAASSLAAELARRAPADIAREAAYGDSLKWVGQAYWYQGDLDNALSNFQAATALLEKAHRATPDNDDLALKLATAHNDAGHVQEAHGDLAAAQRNYSEFLQIFQALHQREPTNVKWLSYLGSAWDNLGKIELEQGHLDRAIADYRADQQAKASIAVRDPANHDAQENLLVSNAILGRTLAICGDQAGALHYTRAAVDSARTLTARDPNNGNWQDDFALYSQQLGNLLRQSGQLDAAASADTDAVLTLIRLVAKDPTSTDYQQDLVQSRLEQARLQLVRDEIGVTDGSIDTALTLLQKLRAKTPGDQGLILLAAEVHDVIGQIAARRHDNATAQGDWLQARDLLAPTARASSDPRFLAAYAVSLLRLGDTKGARPIVTRLLDMGYRTPDFVALATAGKMTYPINVTFKERTTASMRESPATR